MTEVCLGAHPVGLCRRPVKSMQSCLSWGVVLLLHAFPFFILVHTESLQTKEQI